MLGGHAWAFRCYIEGADAVVGKDMRCYVLSRPFSNGLRFWIKIADAVVAVTVAVTVAGCATHSPPRQRIPFM